MFPEALVYLHMDFFQIDYKEVRDFYAFLIVLVFEHHACMHVSIVLSAFFYRQKRECIHLQHIKRQTQIYNKAITLSTNISLIFTSLYIIY